jgi:hypothetical protein
LNVLVRFGRVGLYESAGPAPRGRAKEDVMTRTMTALADRLVDVFAPKATAQAACSGCFEQTCYCGGPGLIYLYKRSCCYVSGCRYECGNCRNVGLGCP